MSQSNLPTKYQGMVLSQDNPFKERAERMIREENVTRNGLIQSEEITLTLKRTYMQGWFTKIFKNKEILADLSPYGCKVLVHIALNLSMDQEKMKISRVAMGLSKRQFKDCMLELLLKQIIANTGKREYYWINVTLLIVGTLRKHEG